MEENPYQSPADDSKALAGSVYVTSINAIRIAVVVVMAFCGAGCVICANIDPGGGTEFGPRTNAIGICFVIGIYTSLVATILLVIEQIIRYLISRLSLSKTSKSNLPPDDKPRHSARP